MQKLSKNNIFFLLALLALNIVGSYFYTRFDLTQDKRFTLTEASKKPLENVNSPILVDVLLEGELPSEFKKLAFETRQILEEFQAVNSNVKISFLNPLEGSENTEAVQQQLAQLGVLPAQVEVQENGKISTEFVYPWAIAYYQEKTVVIPLLKNQLGSTSQERVQNSIQNLEYAFADGFSKLILPKQKKVAVLKGNGELDDKYVADFFKTLKDYYYIAPFTLDSVTQSPQKTFDQLAGFDLIVVANPTESFSDSEKYILDQYIMQGGKSLWLVESTENIIDTTTGITYAVRKDLNLTDFFFKYGVRINPNLVKDMYAAPIMLASGTEQNSQYSRYPWFYSPLSSSGNNHPIVTNIEAVKFDYANAIDTLPNAINKEVLLTTSPFSKRMGTPTQIDINKEISTNLKIINEGPPADFNHGEIPLAVLLEGSFTSVFSNRIKPLKLNQSKDQGANTKMVVISDGTLIKNQLDKGRPLTLGYDKWTRTTYGNKDFLLNTVNYLLEDSGLINIRSKEIAIPFLDPTKIAETKTKWQIVNILMPLGLLFVFGFLFSWLRKKKYRG